MTTLRDEPPRSLEDPREILLQQLSYYRTTLLSKLDGLSEDQLTTSILPSGWSPLGLLKHLVFVERRWMQWGFEAEQVPDPWGDHDPHSEGWLLEPDDTLQALTERLDQIAARTEAVVSAAELTERARLGWSIFHRSAHTGLDSRPPDAGVRAACRAPRRRTGNDGRIRRRMTPAVNRGDDTLSLFAGQKAGLTRVATASHKLQPV
jgi:Protein of unknown function (DUF664)